MLSLRQNSPAALLALALLSFFGCGRSTCTIKGTVTYQSKPVDFGSVVFIVNNKDTVQAMLKPDGSYVAAGVPYGEAKIEVYSRPAEQAAPVKHSKVAPKKEAAIEAPQGVVIPEKYNDKATSDLKVTVNRSRLEFNIELKDPE